MAAGVGFQPTPGSIFLLKGFLLIACPPFFIYQLYHRAVIPFIYPEYAQVLSNKIIITLSLLAVPLFFIVQIFVTLQYHRYRASRLGARLIATPGTGFSHSATGAVVKGSLGRWPGNVVVLQDMMELSVNGYPGDKLDKLLDINEHVFNMRPMFQDVIVTTEPHYIKRILSTDFLNYVKGDRFQECNRPVLGHGVFNADGAMWKFHRSMTRPFFSRDRISDFELFDRHASEIISLMKARLHQGHAIDFQDAMSRFTLDSATEFLFGFSVHSMSTGIPYPYNAQEYRPESNDYSNEKNASIGSPSADAFATAFLDSQFRISQRIRNGWIWPINDVLKDQTRGPMDVVNRFVEPIVKEAVRKNKEAVKRARTGKVETTDREVKEDETLLDHLVMYTTDERVLKEETTNILIAARDTTMATLTFMFFFLAKYPHILQRLREEIIEHVGSTRAPTYDDVKEMRFLRAVINETLRLYPAVPFNIRESVNETVWPSQQPGTQPWYIPAKTQVSYSVFVMHRRKDLWGPDAEEFDPDRFLDERLKKYLLPNNFIFLPFNAGPRICLGQQFAYNEMSFITVRLLQQFSAISLEMKSQDPTTLPPDSWTGEPGRKGIDGIFPKMHLTMYLNGGLWLKMHEAPEVKV